MLLSFDRLLKQQAFVLPYMYMRNEDCKSASSAKYVCMCMQLLQKLIATYFLFVVGSLRGVSLDMSSVLMNC